MLWLKNHPHMIYSLCFVFAVSFLSLFGFVSNSSATSQSFTFTYSDYGLSSSGGRHFDSTRVGFNYKYVLVELVGSDASSSFNIGSFYLLNGISSVNLYAFTDSNGDFSNLYTINNSDITFSTKSNWGSTFTSVTFTFYDSFPIVPCSCPTCPEVPENPYDDKLDKIYNAIIIGSATMLVIYFFYVMYSWYMGGRT